MPTFYFSTPDEYLSIKLNIIYWQNSWLYLFNYKDILSTSARHCYVSWKYSNEFFPKDQPRIISKEGNLTGTERKLGEEEGEVRASQGTL